MRDTRREVRDKWQTILENLGNARRMSSGILFIAFLFIFLFFLLHCFKDTDHKLPAGFMAEAESLLTVSAGASQDRMRNAPAARAMLKKLHTETSVFNAKEPPPERYLFIMVRSWGSSDLVHVSELF